MRRVVAIMAGGRGERLWPHSRTRLPKQFLSIGGGPTFLQQTYDRVAGMPEAPEVVVLTAAGTADLVRAQLPGLAADHLLGEPCARDTAAAAALAVALARAVVGGEALLALVPADHACFDVTGFRAALRAAWDAAARAGCPALIGIPPSRPETGYGYVLRGDAVPGAERVFVVDRFVEKPNLETAAGYLAGGRSLWNSGICCCRTDVLAGALTLHQPPLGELLRHLRGRHPGQVAPERLQAWMDALPAISLDYGVLEHLDRALVVEAALAWDDVGGWEALRRLHPQDGEGNVILGRAVLSQTADTVVYGAAAGRLVVTHGVRDLVVVDTPDSLLIAGRAALPDLKAALREVRAAGFSEHLDGLAAGAVAAAAPSADRAADARPAVAATAFGHAVAFPDCGAEVLRLAPGCALEATAVGARPVALLAGTARLERPGHPPAPLPTGPAAPLPPAARVAAEGPCLLLLGPPSGQEEAAAATTPGAPELRPAGGSHCVEKPWGREVWWARSHAYVGKRIEVASGHALSLQLHERKHETLYFLEGQVLLRLGTIERRVGPGDVAVVPPGTVHRIEALTDAVIFEVSTPEVDDVVRLEDRYGRAPGLPHP